MQRSAILIVLFTAAPAIAQTQAQIPTQPQARAQTRCLQTLTGVSCMEISSGATAPQGENTARNTGAPFPVPNANAYAVQPPIYAPAHVPARTQCWPTENGMDCIVVR